MTTKYRFEPYDVLQCERNGQWQDFSTLRSADEGAQAAALVSRGMWDGQPLRFRIVGPTGQRLVKLEA